MKLIKLTGFVKEIKAPETLVSGEKTFKKYVFRVITSDNETYEFNHWRQFDSLKINTLVEVCFTINSSLFKPKEEKTDRVYYQLTAQACSTINIKS